MIDPALAFQTAVRADLIGAPAVTALVPPDHVRANDARPEQMPAIILAGARTEYLGRAAGGQRVARVSLTLHIWAADDGDDTARLIGAAIHDALEFGPAATPEITVDEWHPLSAVWLRDMQGELALAHGVMALDATVRWRVAP
ncbi:DUF3168 domain-containing protein [Paracoccus marcusii]|uniref:DUF3168 domain-containing protein n=1 Tax=Paracoccus marcusii TaxID=59779 RepID=UPI003266736F